MSLWAADAGNGSAMVQQTFFPFQAPVGASISHAAEDRRAHTITMYSKGISKEK